ncbi:hypothetical protein P7K49_033979 [Saguinus oedipus]|uniref:Uncharacterized protein n=1 Tax=Saguinus oedipus TaxID=9490 RepID=A0ABQ9TV88_SAGOE|nr:hypothetical protein P7K49_033979 [Saguinus oedipus]
MLPANMNVGRERPVEVKNLLAGYPGECWQSHTAVSHSLSISSLTSMRPDKPKMTGPDQVRGGSHQVISNAANVPSTEQQAPPDPICQCNNLQREGHFSHLPRVN